VGRVVEDAVTLPVAIWLFAGAVGVFAEFRMIQHDAHPDVRSDMLRAAIDLRPGPMVGAMICLTILACSLGPLTIVWLLWGNRRCLPALWRAIRGPRDGDAGS
jgi:hypothetical protein